MLRPTPDPWLGNRGPDSQLVDPQSLPWKTRDEPSSFSLGLFWAFEHSVWCSGVRVFFLGVSTGCWDRHQRQPPLVWHPPGSPWALGAIPAACPGHWWPTTSWAPDPWEPGALPACSLGPWAQGGPLSSTELSRGTLCVFLRLPWLCFLCTNSPPAPIWIFTSVWL